MNDHSPLSPDTFSRTTMPPTASSLCVFGSLVTLSGLSCILGTFYDDEIFNIRWAALSFSNLVEYIKYINSGDIHPPVSYLLNKLAFDAFGNWKAVQFVNGTLNAAAIAWFHFRTMGKVADGERRLLTFVLATAVTSEMWGTGLRWNAYFNPVFLILYIVALSQRPSITVRAAILAVGTVFLFHTSYLTLIAAPLLWGTFVATSFHDLRPGCVARIAAILFAAMVVCLPQLYVLVTVHLPHYSGNLMGSLPYSFAFPYSIAQSISTLTVGNAVFPIDYVPAAFLILLAAASVSSARTILRDEYAVALLGGILIGFILLVVLGIGVENRNAVFLYPIALVLIVLAIFRSGSWIRLPAMATLVVLQIASVYGFVFHHDTAKGSYNTPFAQAMREVSRLSRACPGKTYVFTHDPVLTYLVEEVGGMVLSPYAASDAEELLVREKDCVLVVRTYRGVLSQNLYAQYTNPLSPDHFRRTQTINLGYDRFHAVKARIANEPFSDYYIVINAYDVLRDVSVPGWYGLPSARAVS